MAESCGNCGSKIVAAGIFSAANQPLAPEKIAVVNYFHTTNHVALCDNCGGGLHRAAAEALKEEWETLRQELLTKLNHFPLLTVGVLPRSNEYVAMGLVTANVSVGTGIFNEFSQGMSDLFGAVNENSGMALKVNKGEATARAIVIRKALQLGANCVIGVDLDYGVTNNNAATINMQGTAIFVPDLSMILGGKSLQYAQWISDTWARLQQIGRLRRGEIMPGDGSPASTD